MARMSHPALGLIETKTLAAAIAVCGAVTKAAKLVIASAEKTGPDRVTVKIEGDWESVQSAVAAGARAAEQMGGLIALHMIPRTDDEARRLLPYERFLERFLPSQSTRTKPKAQRPERPTTPKPKPAPVAKPTSPPPAPPQASAPTPSVEGALTLQQLEQLSVVKLRQEARRMENLPIQGREISMANKQVLLQAIRTARRE